jgi:hypothetical protein
MNRVAKFYGISEEELGRRSGLLENNLQAYRDMLRGVIMSKIVNDPKSWDDRAMSIGERLEALVKGDSPTVP